jgi:hypothetical protein
MYDNDDNPRRGCGAILCLLLGLLQIVFIGLKLGNIITWTWLWVFSFLWIPILSIVLLLILYVEIEYWNKRGGI